MSIAVEAQDIVFRAAGDTAGLTIKGQLRKAARALGYRDGHWRIRAAWYGEAQAWSAEAFEELRRRYADWEAREARLATEIDRKHATLLRTSAAALEASDEAVDRQEARVMRAYAERIVASCPRDRDE